MKSLSAYIFERVKISSGEACVYSHNNDQFKKLEVIGAIDYVASFINKEHGHNPKDIRFYIYDNKELKPIKFDVIDQSVVYFDDFNSNAIYKYNKNCFDKFYNEICNSKNILQFGVSSWIDGDIVITIQPDSTSYMLTIIFSKDKPVYLDW